MTTTRPEDPAPAGVSGLTPEATHARRLLLLAGQGPLTSRELVVELMVTLVEQGFRNSVAWFLSPSPDDNILEVVFSVQSAGAEPAERRWRDRREIAAVLAEGRRQAAGPKRIGVWSGNGHGLRRCVLSGGAGEPMRFLAPDPDHFAGAAISTASALSAWQNLQLGSPATAADTAPPPPLDLETVVTAVSQALDEVQVHVELGSIEALVLRALRTALADRSPSDLGKAPRGGITSDLETRIETAVGDAVGASLALLLPSLVEKVAASTAEMMPRPPAQPDPSDMARRIAASVLSPSEIAETLVFRLRPILEEHGDRVLHKGAAEANRDREILKQMRDGLARLTERLDGQMRHLEGEIQVDPDGAGLSRPAGAIQGAADSDLAAAAPPLRVLRHDQRG